MFVRTKLTVTAEVAGVKYTGHSVQEFSVERGGDLWSVGFFLRSVNAQAVVVDLPGTAALAVLVDDHRGSRNPLLSTVLSCAPPEADDFDDWWQFLAGFKGPCKLDPTSVPLTVLVPNVASYEGLEVIWQQQTETDGIKLVSATLERSQEPLTAEASATFPWVTDGTFPEPYMLLPAGTQMVTVNRTQFQQFGRRR
ncbi:MAG: hypothetical protein J0I99_15150 [Devosia sp.]|uniref:hypothetical protein n=1 Tax=Devosia sp. TaxID=1871048 RepID=UPI001AD3D0FA|nr:hypothetical protein [Devosia sp.]MBN9317078.1 hypothetical protein [Devosia sp.]